VARERPEFGIWADRVVAVSPSGGELVFTVVPEPSVGRFGPVARSALRAQDACERTIQVKRPIIGLLIIAMLAVALPAAAQPSPDRGEGRDLPASIEQLKLDTPVERSDISATVLDASLFEAEGSNQVIVRLVEPSVAERDLTGNATVQARDSLRRSQSSLMNRIRRLDRGASLLAQAQITLNAVIVEVDAGVLPQLAADPAVERIAPVGNYELDLTETVPYIGGTAVQETGVTGKGIKVAVFDSGIDYTHKNLGGSGDPEEYAANDPTIIEPGTFPTDKVVGGYDFVGSEWPDGPLLPDPDPIDDGPVAGHGTHVADIIGGSNGVAPDADLYAVKVCSSVSSACSGIALIQGMEFAADPNGDGRFSDRVDIINMSLGADYGQPFDDDLSAAVDNATRLGILTVSSAGNGFDKPYVTGTPSSAETALSVAQTAVPSAMLALMQIIAPASIAGQFPAVFQPWSAPLTSVIEGPVQYGDGAGGNLLGCDPFASGSLDGKVVLVDRGACNFSLKIKNIGEAGGLLGIIGLVAPGDPFEGGDGGDRPIDIPGYMISQAVSNRLKSGLPDTVVRFDPAVGIPLAGSVVGSSSRGPQHEDTHLIKPEIGAPGASVSAIAGSGAETGPFGGTSGAAPMVSGSAALLLEATGGTKATAKGRPSGRAVGLGLTPIEVKARLMNTGETQIVNDPLTGELAPITRIGGGEVRVDQAVAATAAAWDSDVASAALSFGFVDVTDTVTRTKTVRIRNYDNSRRTYNVTPTFRFDNDLDGAVSVSAPSSVRVQPGVGRDTTFDVTITIDGSKLRGNYMNSGSQGANPAGLTLNEYDGYLVLDDGKQPLHLPWHVLPRKAAEVVPDTTDLEPGAFPQVIGLDNEGVGTAQNDAYALLAVSDDQPNGDRGGQAPTPDIRAVGINTFPVPAGFCSANDSFIWAFAVNTHERQQHLLPVSHLIELDTDKDGDVDYVVLNRDASGPSTISDGRQLSWVLDVTTGSLSAFFFAEHAMNTGNTVLYICGEQIGMNAADLGVTQVDMDVIAQDFYYGGPGDSVEGLTVTPLGERFYGVASDVVGNTNDAAGLAVYDFGPFPGNSPELGLMLFTNGDRGAGNRGGATQDTEALLFLAP
jgi:minor extracellular serine protease Vpr